MGSPFLDEHGFLRGIPYHDGLLEAVVLSDDRGMIGVRSTQGVCHVIELRRLTAFSAEGVREGNIVLDIRLIDADRIGNDPELAQLVRDRLNADPETLSAKRQLVFYLECSFGAEVLAACSEWSVVRGTFTLTPG